MNEPKSAAPPETRDLMSPGSAASVPAATILFVRMWAVAHIIHLTAATGQAGHALERPRGRRGTGAAAASDVGHMVRGDGRRPAGRSRRRDALSPDHWMLIAFVNLAILVTMASRRSRRRHVIAAAFPAARMVLLVCYGAAALAKYNFNFFDPVTSCATAIAGAASYGITNRLDVGPVWIVSVLACETLIPILLAIPRTRRHGVRLGVAFHFMLSASPSFAVVDFTAALFALFLLFLRDQEIDSILGRIRRLASRSAVVRDASRKPWVTAAVLALVAFGFHRLLSDRAGSGMPSSWRSEIYLFATALVVCPHLAAEPGTPALRAAPRGCRSRSSSSPSSWAASPVPGFPHHCGVHHVLRHPHGGSRPEPPVPPDPAPHGLAGRLRGDRVVQRLDPRVHGRGSRGRSAAGPASARERQP